jgi:hypothetical protein
MSMFLSTLRRRPVRGMLEVPSVVEATACLVDVTDFKSDEGARVPWRVRFPSASATEGFGADTAHIRAVSAPNAYSFRPMRGSSPS